MTPHARPRTAMSATDSAAAAPEGWRLVRRPHGRLDFVAADGAVHEDVDLLRAFPVTAPLGPVAVVAADGTELAWLDALDGLPEAFRARLLEELSAREFLPVIVRIESIADTDPAEWTVTTDRGPRRFTVGSPEDVDRLPDGSAFVVDTAGVRYRFPDLAALDPRSIRLLDKTME